MVRSHPLSLTTRENPMICYSTDPIEMGRIKGERPKYHKSREEKIDGQIETCRKEGTRFLSNKQSQIVKNVRMKIRRGLMKSYKLNEEK